MGYSVILSHLAELLLDTGFWARHVLQIKLLWGRERFWGVRPGALLAFGI